MNVLLKKKKFSNRKKSWIKTLNIFFFKVGKLKRLCYSKANPSGKKPVLISLWKRYKDLEDLKYFQPLQWHKVKSRAVSKEEKVTSVCELHNFTQSTPGLRVRLSEQGSHSQEWPFHCLLLQTDVCPYTAGDLEWVRRKGSEVSEKLTGKWGLTRSSSKNSQPNRGMAVMETISHIFNKENMIKLSSETRMSHLRIALIAKNCSFISVRNYLE